MDTNKKLLYPELSYTLTGVCFSVHNELGSYAREKQYGDLIELKLKESSISYQRECRISDSSNIIDFIIDNKILLELKAKRILAKTDYYQTQRYLQETRLKLALLVNFRNKFIKPVRIVRIDTENKKKY
ncbi:MAG: GxxExxY protein [bacterium]|nr:GxxExxY protein [bacterium]